MRSLTLPAGLRDSILASTVAPSGFGMRLSLTSGVPPISSSTDAATRGRPLDDLFWVMARNPIGNADSRRKKMQRGNHSDVIHRPRRPPLLLGPALEIFQGQPVDHARPRRVAL